MTEPAAEAVPPEERQYYLDTFAGRVLVVAALDRGAAQECRRDGADLVAAGASVVVVTPGSGPSEVSPHDIVGVWRGLQSHGFVDLQAADTGALASRIAVAARAHKLVLVGEGLALRSPDGSRASFVDVASAGLPATLADVARPLYEGVEGVNLVPPGGLDVELFTYNGCGTLLTLGDYGEVRRLGFADYAAVAALVRRGCDQGYLRPRSEAEIDLLLPRALGFFVTGNVPAGVVGIDAASYTDVGLGEVEALYTISRFKGEGVGRRLVTALDQVASDSGLAGLFSVTSSEEAAAFFESCGYKRVAAADLPEAKWVDYPPGRATTAICLLRRL
jgi:amino-acid N-acetyltransferase